MSWTTAEIIIMDVVLQVILGTQYAGEMKKGVFTVMHYFMPKQGILSLHSGCNVGAANDVSLFFGLSGAPNNIGRTRHEVTAWCCVHICGLISGSLCCYWHLE